MKQINPGLRHQCANVGVGILIFLSICLCGLVAFQWVVQSRLREMVETEKAEGNKLRGERQDLENKSRRYSEEISNITELKAKLEEDRKVALTSLLRTTNDLIRLRMEFNYATNVLSQVSNALVQANTNLLIQNRNITDLAAQTKKAMEDRNEIAVKFNEKAKQYVELVTNYNAVVQQFEDFQKQVKEMLEKQNKKEEK
jgi:cell division protein FtsB